MSGGERVEDTRTLQPGDPVRLEVVGVVTTVGSEYLGFNEVTDGARGWAILHDLTDRSVEVYRLPKPLPPEPSPGTEVLTAEGDRYRRDDDLASTWRYVGGGQGDAMDWGTLLRTLGPLRELGDPIEAPR